MTETKTQECRRRLGEYIAAYNALHPDAPLTRDEELAAHEVIVRMVGVEHWQKSGPAQR